MKQISVVILVFLLLTGCSEKVKPVDSWVELIDQGNYEEAYFMINDLDNRHLLMKNNVLENLKLDLIDIENCKYAYEVLSGQDTEVILVGKVKNMSLTIRFDEKENIMSLDYNDPIVIPEVEQVQLDIENIIKEERYDELFADDDLEMAFVYKLHALKKIYGCEDIQSIQTTTLSDEIYNKKIIINSDHKEIILLLAINNNVVDEFMFPLETIIEACYENIKIDYEPMDYVGLSNSEVNADYEENNKDELFNVISVASSAVWYGEMNDDTLYHHLSDRLRETYDEKAFKAYYDLIKKRVLPADDTGYQSGDVSIQVLYKTPYYIGYDFRSYNDDREFVNGFCEMKFGIKDINFVDDTQSIENIYYIKYQIGYIYDYDEVILKGNQKKFLSLLSAGDIESLYAIEVENGLMLTEEEFKRMYDYQLRISGDYKGVMLPVGSHYTIMGSAEVKEYINISSEGQISRIILVLDQDKNVINYNVAFVVGDDQ